MTDKISNMEEIKDIPEGSIAHPEAEKSYTVEKETQCPVCGAKAGEFVNSQGFDGLRLECPNCGRFEITRTLQNIATFKNLSQEEKNKISAYIKEYYTDFNKEFLLHSENYLKILSVPDNFLNIAEENYREKGIGLDKSLYSFAQQYKILKLTRDGELSFHELISRVEELLPAAVRRTNSVNTEIMQKLALALKDEGPFIDLSVGMGGLIWQLDNLVYAQDINKDVLDVAELIAFQSNDKTKIISADSIKDDLPNNGKGIFLFDPPMGQTRIKPKEWNGLAKINDLDKNPQKGTFSFGIRPALSDIIPNPNEDKSSVSEILFILNFLLRADDNAYFICLVPETFLTKNENEYNSLRAYLIKNSLIAVIKPPASPGINTVVLFGQKKKEENKPVKIIDTKKYDNQKVINYIFEDTKITDEEIISDSLNPSEIAEPYLIKMPVIAESKEYEYIPSEKIIDLIKEKEDKNKDIKNIILSDAFLQFKPDKQVNVEVQPDIKAWWDDIKEPQNLREKLADQGFTDFQRCVYLFSSLGCFKKEEKEQDFDVSLLNTFISISCFCALLAYGIVRKEEDKYIIDTRKPKQQNFALKEEVLINAYDECLKPDKQKGEAFVLLSYTDEFVKKVYFDICRYYILGKNQSSTEVYSSKRADVLRALKILEKLGLVRTQVTTDKFIYSHYVPRYYFEGKWIYD